MKSKLFRLICLTLSLAFLAVSSGHGAKAIVFTAAAAEAQAETEVTEDVSTQATQAISEEEANADAPEGEEAAAEAEAAQETQAEAVEETQAEAAPEEQAAPEEAAQAANGAVLTGFSEPVEELVPRLREIFSNASKWTKKKAPKTLDEFPVLPADYESAYEWLQGRTASFEDGADAYLISVQTPGFLTVSDEAQIYFKDMTVLKAEPSQAGIYALDKAQNPGREAKDFWMVVMQSPVAEAWVEDEKNTWSLSASVTVASDTLFGPAGGTDQLMWSALHKGEEGNQTINWIIHPSGQMVIDIYYEDSSVCRELTYDLKTGKLLDSDQW